MLSPTNRKAAALPRIVKSAPGAQSLAAADMSRMSLCGSWVRLTPSNISCGGHIWQEEITLEECPSMVTVTPQIPETQGYTLAT
jgi:hypothetical protein